jgi:hypothetical protein
MIAKEGYLPEMKERAAPKSEEARDGVSWGSGSNKGGRVKIKISFTETSRGLIGYLKAGGPRFGSTILTGGKKILTGTSKVVKYVLVTSEPSTEIMKSVISACPLL